MLGNFSPICHGLIGPDRFIGGGYKVPRLKSPSQNETTSHVEAVYMISARIYHSLRLPQNSHIDLSSITQIEADSQV